MTMYDRWTLIQALCAAPWLLLFAGGVIAYALERREPRKGSGKR